jgi:phosphoribosylamine--glycine ligase
MNSVLIVGSGGREHALLKALLRSNKALCMFAYPGNAGMENNGCMIVEEKITSWKELANWAIRNEIDLTVVGPEIPLVEGIVDTFQKAGLVIFGPSAKAARIEGSKDFAKKLMKKHSIPTAAFESFTDKESAMAYLEEKGAPVVVKASGLAAGKGAIVCDTREEAEDALRRIFDDREFGDAGNTVVMEEKLVGEEASVFALTDGKDYKILPVSQDHKPAFDGDKGPNTGGMGAYAPAPLVDDTLLEQIENEIIKPTLDAMAKEGATYKGLLYAGLIITKSGPQVIEYNCRFGDPETQVVLPLVECDWYDVFMACIEGTLSSVSWTVKEGSCVTVVLASGGYPGKYEKGKVIKHVEDAEWSKSNVDVYHAGTAKNKKSEFITSGGRVLAISALESTLEEAIATAYENASIIDFEGKMFRRDIGVKGLARLKK